ncbi:MAG: nickel-dependent lactate racemase [Rhodospirillales bacterium]|nr:nickel-dependent lactate racemase [Rhodospirillales bacterium]
MPASSVQIAFGRGQLSVRLPDGAQPRLIRKRPLPKLPDPHAAVRAALDSAPLRALAHGRRSACILICDITRPVPNHLFLRPMIEDMTAAGIPLDRITVLVATGLHRPNEGAELAELVGDKWVMQHVRVENHFARNDDDHVDLGATPGRGVPVLLDRRFVAADLRIATGLVEPHFMAGWSGGRKVVAPGVAHHTTIRTFHSARFMEDPLAVQCNLVGNPLHEEQLAIVRMLGEVFALNTVIDEDRDLAFVNFGEIIASHQLAVEFVAVATAVPVGRQFATVLTSAAGYPLDKTYYQTVKGMVTPLDILAPGGTLIIASACSEGFGSAEFRAAQARLVALGPEQFLATLTAKSLADVDEWQTEMQLKPMRLGRVQLYTTGLDAEGRRITGVEMIASVEDALAASLARHGDPAVAVIPEGPYVVPLRG